MTVLPLFGKLLAVHPTTLAIVRLSGNGIALIIQVMIGILTFHKMHHHGGSKRTLGFMFLLSLLFACAFTTAWMFGEVFKLMSHPGQHFIGYATIIFGCLFFATLLATLVVRLHVTFRLSIYEMTPKTTRLFVVLFAILIFLSLVWVSALILGSNGYEHIRWIFISVSSFSFLIVYVVASFLAVRFFVKNLKALAISRVDDASLRDVTVSADVSLNVHQQTLLNLSAKYVLLFVVAIVSTVLNSVLVILVFHGWMGAVVLSLDLCINLFCLYLQFSFAAGHYQKCCFCLDARCRAAVSKRTKREIFAKSISISFQTMGPLKVHSMASSSLAMDGHINE